MSVLRVALVPFALLVSACAATPEPEPVAPSPAAEDSAEARVGAVRVHLDAARAAGGDFATTAQHLQAARNGMLLLSTGDLEPVPLHAAGLDALALEVETVRRELLQERLPAEVYRRLRAAAETEARSMGEFESAKSRCSRYAERELLDHLVSTCSPALQSAWNQLVGKGSTGLSDEEKDLHKRIVHLRKSLRKELMDYWRHREKSDGVVTSFGSGTFVVLGTPDGPGLEHRTPDEWWLDAPVEARAEWLLSWIAVSGPELLQVTRTWDDPCAECEGGGGPKVNDANPSMVVGPICPACSGGGVIRKVSWR